MNFSYQKEINDQKHHSATEKHYTDNPELKRQINESKLVHKFYQNKLT